MEIALTDRRRAAAVARAQMAFTMQIAVASSELTQFALSPSRCGARRSVEASFDTLEAGCRVADAPVAAAGVRAMGDVSSVLMDRAGWQCRSIPWAPAWIVPQGTMPSTDLRR